MDKKMTIVSLVPSLTETLLDLGLEDQVVGRTKFCIHPHDKVRTITKYGGTKDPHVDKIIKLHPDLIIASKEENIKEHIDHFRAVGIKVLVVDIKDFDSALVGLSTIGNAVDRVKETEVLVEDILLAYANITPLNNVNSMYLIWKDPYMTIGGDTYIHDIMDRCGLSNVYGDQERYPSTSLAEIRDSGAEIVLLSSEPFPFSEKDIINVQSEVGINTIKVDGEAFSWYGSRMKKTLPYLQSLIEKIRNDA